MKTFLIIFTLTNLSLAHAQIKNMASAKAVNTVCTQEAETAKCGSDKVGSGLLTCLRDYKKQNKEFVITDSCEASLKQLHRDVKAKRQ